MVVSVIGDYGTPEYDVLLKLVKNYQADEQVLDLGRHKGEWGKKKHLRFSDIDESSLVVISTDWSDRFESRNDVDHAMKKRKSIVVYSCGRFLPFPILGNLNI